MRPLTLLSLLILATFAGGCTMCGSFHPSIQGSGNVVVEDRDAAAFERVALSGGMELYIRVGLPHRVVLHADDNLQEHIRTEVDGDVLEIRFDESVSSEHTLRAEIDLPTLRSLDVSGSAELTVIGVEGERFTLDVSGSCAGELSGWVDTLDIEISGSGRLDARQLEAKHVDVRVSGSGNVKANASETLEVNVSGSGTVTYLGQPMVNVRQSGSARVYAEK